MYSQEEKGDVAVIQDYSEKILTEEAQIRERWREYFRQLLNRNELEGVTGTVDSEPAINEEEVNKGIRSNEDGKNSWNT